MPQLPTNNVCQRCSIDRGSLQMSLFNTQMCCSECIEKERNHPRFEEARDAELTALHEGNYNFPGIGLPEDL
jgi:hypothetical protein